MHYLEQDDPELAKLVKLEEERNEKTLNLIAAESHATRSIFEIMGSIFNMKTIEGYPGARYHAGCQYVDKVEDLAIERAKELFGAGYANVQPHSGTSANLAVYFSVLDIGDKVLAMSLPHGGHLSHGHPASMTSKCFDFEHYSLHPETGLIDYDNIREMALKSKPKMIVAGASSYPRLIDYQRIGEIAREVGAFFLADLAHLAGLVAGKVIPSPVPHCDFVTFTCYKTLAGGRGGVILAKEEYAKRLNRAVFPGGQGTSAVSLIAAKALIFKEAMAPKFPVLQQKILENARHLAAFLMERDYDVVTGGTDNHQVVVDLTNKNISGSTAEDLLEQAGIILNKNHVPSDAGKRGKVSGLRIGLTAVTCRGCSTDEVTTIGNWIHQIITTPEDSALISTTRAAVEEMCARFPVYSENADAWHRA